MLTGGLHVGLDRHDLQQEVEQGANFLIPRCKLVMEYLKTRTGPLEQLLGETDTE